jgi:hypothetical protein
VKVTDHQQIDRTNPHEQIFRKQATFTSRQVLPYMPRYYFDVREGNVVIADPEGQDMANIEAAEREAVEAAASIGRDHFVTARTDALAIEVKDEQRQLVLIVTVSLHVNRIKPQRH